MDKRIEKAHRKLQALELHEAQKHAENLTLRAQAVEEELAKRCNADPWGQAIIRVARNGH